MIRHTSGFFSRMGNILLSPLLLWLPHHPFSGLPISSSSTTLISCTSSGPVPRVTHTHIHLHLPLYKVMSRLIPFFLFLCSISIRRSRSECSRYAWRGEGFWFPNLHFCIHYSRFDLFVARVLARGHFFRFFVAILEHSLAWDSPCCWLLVVGRDLIHWFTFIFAPRHGVTRKGLGNIFLRRWLNWI